MWTRGCIFDLDGVVVDTAKYHFMAWKRLADDMGIPFSENDNERLKGVSRLTSLEIILEIGGVKMALSEKEKLAALKNKWYIDYIGSMTPGEILPGTVEFIGELKRKNIRIALGSASRNTPLILDKIGMKNIFDAIVDGNTVHRVKPHPEVFLMAAEMIGIEKERCMVFEDALAGVEAALSAGMICIGIGNRNILKDAHMVVNGLKEMDLNKIMVLEKRLGHE